MDALAQDRELAPTRAGFGKTLEHVLRARFPFVYVDTWEEERLLEEIEQVAASLTPARTVYSWARTTGLVGPDAQDARLKSPLDVLTHVEECTQSAVFVLKDFHVVLRERGEDETEQVIRKMRDLTTDLREGPGRCVIIVAPMLVLPSELEKDVTVVPFGLPTLPELREALREMVDHNRSAGRIVIDIDETTEVMLSNAALGLTLQEARKAFARAMVADNRLDAGDVRAILEEKRQIIRRTEILDFVSPTEGLEDVGGLENLKRWLRKRSDAWREEARRYCLPFPKGLLIIGVPGCGKSLTAKCTSSAWNLPLLRLDIGRVFSSLLGDSEAHMRTALRTAEAIAPSVLWIDEIEKGFGGATGPSLDSGTSARVFGSFLTWMQEKEHPVFVIATANSIERLPPEFMRKGRFDEIFFVDVPSFIERRRILELHLRKRLRYPEAVGDLQLTDELLDALTVRCAGFTGAEVEEAVITALFEAFADRRSLRIADLEYAIDHTVPLGRTQAEEIRALQQWAHERAVQATAPEDRDANGSPQVRGRGAKLR